MRQQMDELGFAVGTVEDDRRREIAEQRRHRRLRDVLENEDLFAFAHVQDSRSCARFDTFLDARLDSASQIHVVALRVDQANGDRDQVRRFLGLPR